MMDPQNVPLIRRPLIIPDICPLDQFHGDWSAWNEAVGYSYTWSNAAAVLNE